MTKEMNAKNAVLDTAIMNQNAADMKPLPPGKFCVFSQSDESPGDPVAFFQVGPRPENATE